jgi:hypothetical protein
MSATTTSTTPSTPDVPVETRSLPESLWSQSFIYAMCMLPIAAGVLAAAFMWLDKQVASTLAGTALGLLLAPSQFFFGAAKHQPTTTPGTVTTPSTPVTTVVTTTPTTPGTVVTPGG